MYHLKDHFITLLILIGNLYIICIRETAANSIRLREENERDLTSSFNIDGGAPRSRVRRQYYVCPPDFERISSNCYYFSRHMATWQDAHYDCKDRHSELAILQNAAEDKKLRGQLNKSPKPLEWWIGGIYDWEQMKWKWGASGKPLNYHGFSRMGPDNKDKLKWHCIILDPSMKYKWSGRSCVLGKHYICQKKVMRVGKRGLDKLRRKYNNTLNEVPAPLIYEKTRKPKKQPQHQQQLHHRQLYNNNAYGHRINNTQIRKANNNHNNNNNRRKNNNNNNNNSMNRKNRKNRKNKNKNRNKNNRNYGLQHNMMRNMSASATDFSMENGYNDEYRKSKKRNRRYKSKESKESKENNSNDLIQTFANAHAHAQEEEEEQEEMKPNSIEELTQKTTFMTNTLSPFHPQVIVEEHDFFELNNN